MKDDKIDRVAGELTGIVRQWFAEERHSKALRRLAEQPNSGIRPDDDRNEALEPLVHDTLRDLESVLMMMKACLAALEEVPDREDLQHYLAVLEMLVSQLNVIIDTFSSVLTVERPVKKSRDDRVK